MKWSRGRELGGGEEATVIQFGEEDRAVTAAAEESGGGEA